MTFYKYILFLLALVLTINLQAISPAKEVPNYSFFNTKYTSIQYPNGDSTVYYNLFEKMDSLLEHQKNINILHIGGSHIQAGMWSDRVRSNLANALPYANHGLIFPFSAAKTNNPVNFRTTYNGEWSVARNVLRDPKYPLGLTGMCIGTKDSSATITIKLHGDSLPPVSEIAVLANKNAKLLPYVNAKDSVYSCSFDSLKQAYIFNLGTPTDSFTLQFKMNTETTAYDDFQLRGFWINNAASGVNVINIGVNGASVPSYLKCELLEQDLALVKPDLCILSIGINDASGKNFDTTFFKNNYRELIRKIHNVAPDCAILFTTNNDSYRRVKRRYYNNQNGLKAQKAFYALASEYNTGVWDLYAYMGGATSMAKWQQNGLARRDKIHFSQQGYQLIGDLLFNALMYDYKKYKINEEELAHVE